MDHGLQHLVPRAEALRASLPGGGVVGVLTGGRSRERDRSLLSGGAVFASLRDQGFDAVSVDTAQPNLVGQLAGIDVAFLAIAGRYAEDGALQGLLETLRVPYTGSGVLASALSMNKSIAKVQAVAGGLQVLPSIGLASQALDLQELSQVLSSVPFPAIVKPEAEGGSIDMIVCNDSQQLHQAVRDVRRRNHRLLVEQFCVGVAVTVGVLATERGVAALPTLETRARGNFYDYRTKRDPSLYTYHCPANLSPTVTASVGSMALVAHRALRCSGYSRSDFVATQDGQVYWLELNTLPGLSAHGNMATMAAAAGLSYDELVLIMLASHGLDKDYSTASIRIK